MPSSNAMSPNSKLHRKAVFLDRDGTLNEEIGYLHRAEDWRWLPGAKEAIGRLKNAGWLVVIVTNQAGIGRGYYTGQELQALHDFVQQDLAAAGAGVDAIYHCPHHPDAGCACRKPGAGLFEQAARELDIDLAASVVVGDKYSDVLPGRRLGCRAILVLTGYGRSELAVARAAGFEPDGVCADLAAAADWIVEQEAEP